MLRDALAAKEDRTTLGQMVHGGDSRESYRLNQIQANRVIPTFSRLLPNRVGGILSVWLTICPLFDKVVIPHAGNMPKEPSSGATPTISRVLPDGTMIELLYDADKGETSLVSCPLSGTPTTQSRIELTDQECLVPYAPNNNLLTSGCVLLPSAIGEYTDKAALLADIKAFIHRYVDLSPLFEDIAAHYVLLSWVHDAFNDLPYLRFRGEFGTGKTRALLAIGSISYKPFFASGASTVSPIFHILHEFGGTLVLDEADLRFSDATADLTKILNNGNMKGLPVLRTMTNRHRELNPQAFKVFGPKLIAMRESFADEALESRFLTEETGNRPLRDDISIHLPDAMKTEALHLRNKLLSWRFVAYHQAVIDPLRMVEGISPRGNQTALALLSLVDDSALRDAIGSHLAMGEVRAAAKRASLPHIAMVSVLTELFRSAPRPYLPLRDVADRFNQDQMSALPIKSVGHLIRSRLGIETTKTRGVYVIAASERSKVDEFAVRYGLTRADDTERAG